MEYRIERKIDRSRVFFFPTVNGHRISRTNFARKYDAQNLAAAFRAKFTEPQIAAMIAGKAERRAA